MLLITVIAFAFIVSIVIFIVAYSRKKEYSLEDIKQMVLTPEKLKERQTVEFLEEKGIKVSINPLEQLDTDAHTNASRVLCSTKGYGYSQTLDACVYTNKQSCEELNKTDDKNFYQWNGESCVFNSNLFKNLICGENGLPYSPAEVTCDAKGKCTTIREESCIITREYCKSKGLDYSDNNTRSNNDTLGRVGRIFDGLDDVSNEVMNNNPTRYNGSDLGDCTSNDAQRLSEILLGRDVTRKFKLAGEKLVDECRSNPLSLKCGEALGLLAITGPRILGDATREYFLVSYRNIRDGCSKFNSLQDALDCFDAIYTRIPFVLVGNELVNIVDNLLSLIPGYPPGSLNLVTDLILRFPPRTIVAYGRLFGPDALRGIVKYGEIAIGGLSKFGNVFVDGITKYERWGLPAVNFIANYGSYGIEKIKTIGESMGLETFFSRVANMRSPSDFANLAGDTASNIANRIEDEAKNVGNAIFNGIRSIF